MTALHTAYAAAGLLAVVLILVSRSIRRYPVTEPLLALVLGALLGSAVLGVLVIPDEIRTTLLLESTRALLAISLIGVALRFPARELRSVARPVVLLVLVVMPLAAAVTGALGALLLGLPVALAALLGACLSPTDPVLASGVVTGKPAEKALPGRLRHIVTEESGFNDGLALPLVLIAMAPALGTAASGEIGAAAYQVVVGALVGAALGWLAGRAVRHAEEQDEVEGPPELILTLLLALAVLGVAEVLETNGVLAAFVAGLMYNGAVGERDREKQDVLDEAFNRYLIVPVFLLIGTVLPFAEWLAFGWGSVAFAVGVLLLRRPPVVLLLQKLLGVRPRDAVFAGWFGPIGVSAVFYLVLAEDEGVTDPRLFAAGTLAVAVSTLAHGLSAIPAR
ncbi:MAG: cation:proton antiporter, partial [Acidimicrobiales bacterium]